MKLESQKLVLPVLLALSLTTCTAFLLYYALYKKKDKNDTQESIVTSRPSLRPISLLFKVPRQCLPAIIGRGGATINNIQNKTGTWIKVNKADAVPSLDSTCIIQGSEEGVALATIMIRSIVDNHSK